MKVSMRCANKTRTAVSLTTVVVAMCVVVDYAAVRGSAQTAAKSKLSSTIDRDAMTRVSGPTSYDDDVGGLTSVGCYVQRAKSHYDVYALTENKDAGASVHVVAFPRGYEHAAHDAFGALLMSAASDEKPSGRGDLGALISKIKCMQWEFADGTKGGTICYSENAKADARYGSVRWLAASTDVGPVSVGIGYRNLSGLPGQLVDKYLREYPSTVPENPTWHHDWETKDLEKWAAVLRSNKDDLHMLQAGAVYLTRYDKRSFGLLDALKKRDDAAAYSQALEGVSERMSQVVEERKTVRDRAEQDE